MPFYILKVDFDINTGRQFQVGQRIHRFVGRTQDVDQTLVGSGFKLLAAVFIFVNSPQNGYHLALCRQRDRAGYSGAGPLCGLYDLFGRLVDQNMVVALDSDSDFLFCHLLVRLLKF